jgi:hypothetical protein
MNSTNTPRYFAPLLILAACIPTHFASAETNNDLRCGFAVADITPPIGYRMSGYFYERFSTGVAHPLEAKAVVLQQGNERFAWVFCDLVGVPRELTTVARDEIAKQSNIPRGNIFIAATHTHTGPLYFGALRNYFHNTAVKKDGADTHETTDYSDTLRSQLVALVAKAADSLQPTRLAFGIAKQEGLSFNRRYVLKDGSVRTNPGKANPNIVRPAGPIDPDVGILQFRRDDRAVAGITIFALHLDTTGGTEFAPDFPFFLTQKLHEEFGNDYLSIFGTGTCGNINHFDLMNNKGEKGFEESRRIGETLAATVKAALPKLSPVAKPQLAAASVTLQVPLQDYTESEMSDARANMSKVGTGKMPMLEQVKSVKIVGIEELHTDKLPMDVQAFRLSDSAALVALPGELFVELGLAIKQSSPFENTFVVELANDYPGYIPTKPAYAEGSYEPTNSKLAPGGGEMLRDAAIELLKKLHAK